MTRQLLTSTGPAQNATAAAPAPPAQTPGGPMLGLGTVHHQRLRPVTHHFRYGTWFLLLPMRQLREQPHPALPRNRRSWVSFHDSDHGDGRLDSLAWLDELLQAEGVLDAQGEVWLQTVPRVLGYAFKPVSFWYAHRTDGSLAAIVAEVNNTFGQRHAYLLDGPQLAFGHEQLADKVLQVSPFCRVEGRYRFCFTRRTLADGAEHLAVRIAHDDATGPLLLTGVEGRLQALTRESLRRTWRAMPMLTLAIIGRIHWQALRLLLKRVPFHGSRPDHPPDRPASA